MLQQVIKKPMSARNKKTLAANIVIGICMLLVSLILIIPFLWMLVSSFQPTPGSIFQDPPRLPEVWRFANYADVFREWNFFQMLGNTMIVVVCSMVISIAASVLVAYGFARFRAKGKNIVFGFMLSTMMLPWVVTLMPSYILFSKIGWTGTFLPLIVPAIGGGAFNIFLLRQYMMGIPRSLDEAGIIDGCSRLGVLIRLIVPQCMPILATLVVFSFNGAWSDYVGPSIYLMGAESKYTLSVGITVLKNQAGGMGEIQWQMIMAACIMFSLPMILVLFVAQNAFIRGIVTTGLKD